MRSLCGIWGGHQKEQEINIVGSKVLYRVEWSLVRKSQEKVAVVKVRNDQSMNQCFCQGYEGDSCLCSVINGKVAWFDDPLNTRSNRSGRVQDKASVDGRSSYSPRTSGSPVLLRALSSWNNMFFSLGKLLDVSWFQGQIYGQGPFSDLGVSHGKVILITTVQPDNLFLIL